MKTQRGNGEIGILLVIGLACWALALGGCAGPLLLGIKEYRGSDGSVTKFITGADFSVSANGVDTVENIRGIKASEK